MSNENKFGVLHYEKSEIFVKSFNLRFENHWHCHYLFSLIFTEYFIISHNHNKGIRDIKNTKWNKGIYD